MKNNDIYVELYKGKSKKSGNDFEAVKVSIGEWSSLIFPRSAFELNYIKKVLGEDDNANEN